MANTEFKTKCIGYLPSMIELKHLGVYSQGCWSVFMRKKHSQDNKTKEWLEEPETQRQKLSSL